MKEPVLIVEDSYTQALRLRILLERVGLTVVVAPSGQQGIATAMSQPSRAIILDVNLPDMDGFQVCQVLKGHPTTASIPILVLSTRDRVGDTISGLSAGADVYIPKDAFAEVNLLQALRDLAILATAPSSIAEVSARGGKDTPEGGHRGSRQ